MNAKVILLGMGLSIAALTGCASDACTTDVDCPANHVCLNAGGVVFSGNECVPLVEALSDNSDMSGESDLDFVDASEGDLDLGNDGVEDMPEAPLQDMQDADLTDFADADLGDMASDQNNPNDRDGDNVPDSLDNCPDVYNPSQASENGGIGDACNPEPVGELCLTQELKHDYVPPEFYVLLDLSGSMSTKLEEVGNAFFNSSFSDQISTTRFGLGTFQAGMCPGFTHHLDIGIHSPTTLALTWASFEANASGPLRSALQAVQAEMLGPNGFGSGRRNHILIFDGGDLTGCMTAIDEVEEIRTMLMQNVRSHIIGYQYTFASPNLPQSLAAEGGTAGSFSNNQPHFATNASNLRAVLNGIHAQEHTLSHDFKCEIALPPGNYTDFWVEVLGTRVPLDPQNGYTHSGQQLILHGAACDAARIYDEDETVRARIQARCSE